jgi:GntR family transcriptional regulator
MEFKDNEAIYLQIAGLVCENVLTGKWAAGQKILSVRDLAVELEVNPNTVMRAYELLQELQIVYNRRGQGLFVAEDGLALAIAWRKQNFVELNLPEFFKNIYLLEIPIEEILRQYDQYLLKQIADGKSTKHHENKH